MTRSIKHIEQTTIVASDEHDSLRGFVNNNIDTLIVKSSLLTTSESFSNLLSISQRVLDKESNISSKNITYYDGLVFIDPLYFFFRKPFHLNEAIRLFCSQSGEPRPWRSVISVDPLPSHYHPKKILKIRKTGELDYFHKDGNKVFRRQQLDREKYYRENRAIFIIDSKVTDYNFFDKKKMICHIVEKPVIRIESKNDIDLINALNRIMV